MQSAEDGVLHDHLMAFLDGHVESMSEVPVASPSSWSASANALRAQIHLGYLSNTNTPYTGK